jgi:archaellum component FlaC
MSKIQEIINDLDTEMNRLYTEYLECHKDLDPHRGHPVGETNLDEVNRILKVMQEKFIELYPALNFIATRYEFATNATNSFNDFFDGLKKASSAADSKIIEA